LAGQEDGSLAMLRLFLLHVVEVQSRVAGMAARDNNANDGGVIMAAFSQLQLQEIKSVLLPLSSPKVQWPDCE
jgi:hypothetical protein